MKRVEKVREIVDVRAAPSLLEPVLSAWGATDDPIHGQMREPGYARTKKLRH